MQLFNLMEYYKNITGVGNSIESNTNINRIFRRFFVDNFFLSYYLINRQENA